jgi:uncharacterized surface protein with fasciclin (FAS1) repeats
MRIRVLVAPALAALALAACSSSNNDNSSATTAAATTAAPSTTVEATTTTVAAPTTEASTTTTEEPTTTEAQPATVADVLREPEFVQLGLLLGNAKLFPTLEGTGPFTVFAPSNDAMTKLGADTLNALGKDAAAATPILLYHVVPGKYLAADLKTGDLATATGKPVHVVVNGDEITVNGAKVIKKDIEAGNGVVQVIDAPLTPPAG